MTYRDHRTNHWDVLQVTDDPAIEALLRPRIDDLSSRRMTDYARSLGLEPPGGGNPPIVLHFPAGADITGDGLIVWDLRTGRMTT